MSKSTILFIIFILIAIFIVGCATTFKLSPVIENYSGNNIEKLFFEGNEVAWVKSKDRDIMIYGIKTGGNIVLHVLFNNRSDKNINVIPESISVVGINEYDEKVSLKVYSAEEYLKKMRNTQMLALVLQATGNAMSSMNSGRSTTTTNTNTYVSGNVGGNSFYGTGNSTSTSTTYDPSKQAEINRRNQEQLERNAKQYRKQYAATKQGLLKKTTLFPNYYIEGNVMVKYERAMKYIVKIPFGNETFTLEFKPVMY